MPPSLRGWKKCSDNSGKVSRPVPMNRSDVRPLTFGEDVHHELYLGVSDGDVYRIVGAH